MAGPTAFAVGLVAVLFFTPGVIRLAESLGAVDEPGPRRVHKRRVPRLGGLAIVAGAGLAFGFVLPATADWPPGFDLRLFLASLSLVLVVGIWDDFRGTSAAVKFSGQIAAASIAWHAGLQVDKLSIPFAGSVDLGFVSMAFTIFWIVGVTNAINLIDGLDGLAAGICAIAFGGIYALYWDGGNQHSFGLMAAAAAGACLGFLRYNFHPARVFMGDSGSLTLGFLLACMSLVGNQKLSTATFLTGPIILLAVPLVDTLACFARRVASGRSPFDGDLGHVHHLLLGLGWSQRRVCLVLYGVSTAFAVGAVALSNYRDGLFLGAVIGGGLLLAAVFYHRYRVFSPHMLVNGRRLRRILDLLERRLGSARDLPTAADLLRRAVRLLGLTHLAVHRDGRAAGAASVLQSPDSPAPLGEALFEVGRQSGPERRLQTISGGRILHIVFGDRAAGEAAQLYARQLLLSPVLIRLAERLESFEPAAHPLVLTPVRATISPASLPPSAAGARAAV